MKNIACVYARALLEVAVTKGKKEGDVTVLRAQLEQLAALVESSKELKIALYGPAVSVNEKTALVETLSGKMGLLPIVTRFLSLLAKKNRLSVLPGLPEALDEVRLEAQGGTMGALVSADHLDAEMVQAITLSFKNKLKRPVEFRVKTDPELLAGLKVTVNGVTYDGSLRSQLERLRESFVHGVWGAA